MATAQGLSTALQDARQLLWQSRCPRQAAARRPGPARRGGAGAAAALPAATPGGAPPPVPRSPATAPGDDGDGGEEQLPRGRPGRGAGYYRRYLANRRARGGEFLEPLDPGGPPPPPAAWLPQLGDEPLPRGAGALAHGNVGGGAVGAPAPWPGSAAHLRAVVRGAVDAARLMAPPEVSRPRDAPDRMRDRVPAPEAADLLARLRPGDGAVVGPPDPGLLGGAASGLAPLPALRAAAEASARGEPVAVHVFWDLASVHPRALDPRVVAAQLGRALGSYGEVASAAVYATRRLLAWVPEALMRRHAPGRLPAFRTAAARPSDGGPDEGAPIGDVRLMCPVCGRPSRGYALLQRHMRAVHDRKAPPQGEVQQLDAREAEGGPPRKQRGAPGVGGALSAADAAAVAAAWDGSLTNSRDRTLGRVAAYTSAGGVLFVPRGGTQVSLKYCLVREGWEARVVQNEREAVDESVAGGVEALLRELEDARGEAAAHTVVAVVSDTRTHAALLARARRLGCSTVAVCDKRGEYPEADALLRWRMVTAGRYSTGGSGSSSSDEAADAG